MNENVSAFELLSRALAEFHYWVELPRLGHLSVKLMCEFSENSRWSDPYRVDASLAGCYACENEEGKIYYIGSASANSSFGYRFANGYVSRNPDDTVKRSGNAESAHQVYVGDVPREWAFIAPALEQFLISYILPANNSKDRIVALTEKLHGPASPTASA